MNHVENLARADAVGAQFRAALAAANDLPEHHRLAVLAVALNELLTEARPDVVDTATTQAVADLAAAAEDAALALTTQLAVNEARAVGKEPPGELLRLASHARARARARLARLPPPSIT